MCSSERDESPRSSFERPCAFRRRHLQRLGYLLVQQGKFISEDDLREALRVQVTQIVYRLFRWREGSYRFTPVEHLEYDREHFIPVSAETILMEGARMVDEWPIIERRIKSAQMVFRKTEAAVALEAGSSSRSWTPTGVRLSPRRRPARAIPASPEEIHISPEEREVSCARWTAKRQCQAIVDRCLCMGEFDVYRISVRAVSTAICSRRCPAARPVGPPRRERIKVPEGSCSLVLHDPDTGGGWRCRSPRCSRNPLNPWKMAVDDSPASRSSTCTAAGAGWSDLERAVQVFYLDLGALPRQPRPGWPSTGTIERERDLSDPWGRPYGFELDSGRLPPVRSTMAEGRRDARADVGSHRLSSAQRSGPAEMQEGTRKSADSDSR